MVYVSSDGKVLQNRPWSVQRVVDLFWAFLAAVMFFFQSLIGMENKSRFGGNGGRSRSGGGGPGNGPGGGGGGGGPKRRMGTMQDVIECNAPGGG